MRPDLTERREYGRIKEKGAIPMETECRTVRITNNKVNIKELAEAMEVSTASISLALSGKGNISDSLRRRILTKAKELGYTPSLQAKTLRKSSLKIAVVLPASPAHICNKFKTGIQSAVNEFSGGKLECVIYEYLTSDTDAYAAIEDILRSDYDGVILSLDDLSEERCFFDIYEEFNRLEIPVLSMGNKMSLFSSCCTAWIDARKGGAIAADMFHLMGCREVLVLTGSAYSSIHRRYINGFAAAMRGYGMKIFDIGYTEDLPEKTARATREIMPRIQSENPGIFLTTCYSWAVCDALREIQTPARVIGMDLLPQTEAYLLSGELSATICQHQTLQAKETMQKLLELILSGSGSAPLDDIVIEPYLITRASISKAEY